MQTMCMSDGVKKCGKDIYKKKSDKSNVPTRSAKMTTNMCAGKKHVKSIVEKTR